MTACNEWIPEDSLSESMPPRLALDGIVTCSNIHDNCLCAETQLAIACHCKAFLEGNMAQDPVL